MMLLSSQTLGLARRKPVCPICGAPYQTCGGPTTMPGQPTVTVHRGTHAMRQVHTQINGIDTIVNRAVFEPEPAAEPEAKVRQPRAKRDLKTK